MVLVWILVAALILALALYIFSRILELFPIPANIRQIILLIVALVCIIYLVSRLGWIGF